MAVVRLSVSSVAFAALARVSAQLQSVEGGAQVGNQVGEIARRRFLAGDQYIVMTRLGANRQYQPRRLLEAATCPVADDGLANFLAGREADANIPSDIASVISGRRIAVPVGLQHDSGHCALLPVSGDADEFPPLRQPTQR